jgi:hypothetical protein
MRFRESKIKSFPWKELREKWEKSHHFRIWREKRLRPLLNRVSSRRHTRLVWRAHKARLDVYNMRILESKAIRPFPFFYFLFFKVIRPLFERLTVPFKWQCMPPIFFIWFLIYLILFFLFLLFLFSIFGLTKCSLAFLMTLN